MLVALTEGDTPFLVSIRPCTIQGWRPLSVRIQPAVFMRNGAITAQVAMIRNHLAVASVLRRTSHSPHTASRKTRPAR